MNFISIAPPPGAKCAKCGLHNATQVWTGEGGMIGWVHGMFAYWCRCCTARAQLAHIRKAQERIALLEKEVAEGCVSTGSTLPTTRPQPGGWFKSGDKDSADVQKDIPESALVGNITKKPGKRPAKKTKSSGKGKTQGERKSRVKSSPTR